MSFNDRRTPGSQGSGRRGRLYLSLAAICLVSLVGLSAVPATAGTYMTIDEALELAFPGAEFRRGTVFLEKQQIERVEKLAGTGVRGAIVYPYRAYRDDVRVGTVYFDAHRVRTLPETLMVAVDPSGNAARVEVLSFKEPEEYLPDARWYRQFFGRRLDKGLQLKRDIAGITGATLTSRATTDAVRRVLAVHQVIENDGKP